MSESTNRIQAFQNPAQAMPVHEEKTIQRVAAYCRVSTLQEEQADSYETQCACYRNLIEANPTMVLVDVYGDQGISGLSAKKRPEFQRMMQDCMDGKVDIVMTKSISRFARNLADCVNCVRQLKEKGIPVLFEKEGLSSMEEGCEFVLSMLATMAQEEANNISQSLRWALEHRNASGNPSRKTRYGYRRVVDENGKKVWRIDEQEAKRVRLAFTLAAQEQDYRTILCALNEMEAEEDSDLRWKQSRVYDMLRNEAYIGDILTNKIFTPDYLTKRKVRNKGQRTQYYIEGHHEPIIDRETFEKVGALISRKALQSRRMERNAKS